MWLAFFLLAASSAFAIEDFTATGTGQIATFACSPAEGAVTVTNIGTTLSNYELIAEGDAQDWVLFVPEAFTLAPGQSQTVQEFFAVPCDAEDAFLDVVITTDELELLLTQDVIVQTPNNIQITPVVYSQEVLPCDPATFTYVLHNPADFTETYALKVLDVPAPATLSDITLSLLPHENETIAVTIDSKDCALSGDFTPLLVVKTQKSKIASEIELLLRINDTDIPEIAKGIDSIRAGFEPQEAQVEITNIGDRTTTYLLDVDGAAFVSILPEQATISARQTEDVKLVIQPVEGTQAGTYPLTITAQVEATGKEYTKQIAIKLGPPTFIENLFGAWLPFTIAGIVLLIIVIILILAGVKKYRSPEFQAKLAERRAAREKARQERLAAKEEKLQQREEEQRLQEAREAKEAERRERELERERFKAQRPTTRNSARTTSSSRKRKSSPAPSAQASTSSRSRSCC